MTENKWSEILISGFYFYDVQYIEFWAGRGLQKTETLEATPVLV
jgi:hypothetical protein